AQLERDLLKDVIHLGGRPGVKSLAARNAGEFVQDALSLHAQRAADVAAAEDSNGVEYDVRFLQYSTQFVEGVTRVVILSVADQQQRAFRMGPALYALDSRIAL